MASRARTRAVERQISTQFDCCFLGRVLPFSRDGLVFTGDLTGEGSLTGFYGFEAGIDASEGEFDRF